MTFDNGGAQHRADDDVDSTIFSGKFWKRTADRAVKSFAYSLLVTFAGPAIAAQSGAAINVPWQGALIGTAAMTGLSLLGSFAGKAIGNNPNDPAWVNTK